MYQTYIRTSPEQLWRALTEPAFTERYWGGLSFDTDWEAGSTMAWRIAGATVVDPDQVVIESDPYRRLTYSWHSYTPEWAAASGIDEALRAVLAAERRSTVTFDIEDLGEAVKLTVLHGNFEGGQHRRHDGARRLAARDRRPQVAARDRRAPVDQLIVCATTTLAGARVVVAYAWSPSTNHVEPLPASVGRAPVAASIR